jgi:hypothetical protein
MPTQPDLAQHEKSRQDALKRAAEIVNGTSGALAPVPVLLRLSLQTINARDQAAVWAKGQIGALWAATNPYDDAAVADFASQSAQVMKTAQDSAGRTAGMAQSLQLRSMGVNAGSPDLSLPLDVRSPSATIADGTITLDPRPVTVDYTGATARITPQDMTTEAVFARPAETFRYVAAEGNKSGLRWIDDAKAQSNLRISTLVDDNLMLAQRFAQQEVIAQAVDLDKPGPKIIGYRRVIHPERSKSGTCGMCIVAADRMYYVAELMPLHTHCECTIAAVTAQHDPADDANAADLKQLYKDAGGKTAAHLKRTRYQIDEHGELGPTLVPKKPYTPRVPKKKPVPTPVEPKPTVPSADLQTRDAKLSALLDSIDLNAGVDH